MKRLPRSEHYQRIYHEFLCDLDFNQINSHALNPLQVLQMEEVHQLREELLQAVLLAMPHILTLQQQQVIQYFLQGFNQQEIADKMHVSPRTIDGYRDGLFEKLGVKTRVGLVMYSLKKGIV